MAGIWRDCMSVGLFVYTYMSVCMFIHPLVHLYTCQYICTSVSMFIYLLMQLPNNLGLHPYQIV